MALYGPDPGRDRPQLKEALEDCAPSLSPAGTKPVLSTFWIDRILADLRRTTPGERVIASGNAWTLLRQDDVVEVRFG